MGVSDFPPERGAAAPTSSCRARWAWARLTPRSAARALAAASPVRDPSAADAILALGRACRKRSAETPSCAAIRATLGSTAMPGLAVVLGVGALDGVSTFDGPATATAPVVPAITAAATMPPITTRLAMVLLPRCSGLVTGPTGPWRRCWPARHGEYRSTRSDVTSAEQRLLSRCHSRSERSAGATGESHRYGVRSRLPLMHSEADFPSPADRLSKVESENPGQRASCEDDR